MAPEITVRGDRTVPKITDREPPALAEQPPAVPVVRGEPAVQVAWGGMARPDVMVVTGR
ncbi:hypothetical protein BVY51_004672 [Salmonella enterica subsp. enterica serovar Sandiego]|nr:hypothetical protein [Salmonella enterica subsp. enterica serovar Sandiego]EDT9995538.1 hypothetical protein [Salmonella enterica]EDU0465844.1 hypothetical protein [Salmonella enterica]EDW3313381.1 hypothetical protein [Salmonella enterica]EEG3603630.1 hypothetical protein [Salmonella enterica]